MQIRLFTATDMMALLDTYSHIIQPHITVKHKINKCCKKVRQVMRLILKAHKTNAQLENCQD